MSPKLDQNAVKRIVAVAMTVCIVGIAVLLYACTSDNDRAEGPEEVASLPPLAATEIHSGLDYALDTVAKDKTVPALFIDSLDVNLDRIRDVEEKKATFFRIMLPHIARENDRIRAERSKIYDAAGDVPAPLFEKYEVDDGSVDELLRRVDVVPASLVLAQAALESGWGTSRFARKGNNFFGMRTYNEDVKGMEPREADGFKVMVFRDIGHSVRVYMKNLNTHDAYADFRQARAKERASGAAPTGHTMTNYLTSYSEIPEKYGKRLRGMIDRNDLHRFDGVRVADN
ncbi:MAG: glucosaminidase domain-containing protein [Rhodospirillales bacterium]|nr:glucosaminidase domain-containing protein [Rhodospirillales bacterium]MBO6787788.1 glucosaminidase domain-containing protein [Rhodospirillales bacterium]